jgi:hypothetical protein
MSYYNDFVLCIFVKWTSVRLGSLIAAWFLQRWFPHALHTVVSPAHAIIVAWLMWACMWAGASSIGSQIKRTWVPNSYWKDFKSLDAFSRRRTNPLLSIPIASKSYTITITIRVIAPVSCSISYLCSHVWYEVGVGIAMFLKFRWIILSNRRLCHKHSCKNGKGSQLYAVEDFPRRLRLQ